MSESSFILQNCARAIVGSEDAIHLLEQKSRLEQAVSNNDPALTLDTAKALLESIFKTILSDRVTAPDLALEIGPLYKKVREVIVLNHDNKANDILIKLTSSIVHHVAELRNKYGAASHGDDGYFESPIQMPEAEMVAHIVDGMGGFLFKKHKNLNNPEFLQRIYYKDYDAFNDWLDLQNESIKIPVEGANPIVFSYFLFSYDVATYRAMLLQYIQTEKEDLEIESDGPVIGEIKLDSIQEPVTLPNDHSTELDNADYVKNIADALILNDEVRQSISDDQSLELAVFVQYFSLNQAGVDWQNRESLIARFRNILKRRLIKIAYSEAFINQAIDLIIEKAKQYFPSKSGSE